MSTAQVLRLKSQGQRETNFTPATPSLCPGAAAAVASTGSRRSTSSRASPFLSVPRASPREAPSSRGTSSPVSSRGSSEPPPRSWTASSKNRKLATLQLRTLQSGEAATPCGDHHKTRCLRRRAPRPPEVARRRKPLPPTAPGRG